MMKNSVITGDRLGVLGILIVVLGSGAFLAYHTQGLRNESKQLAAQVNTLTAENVLLKDSVNILKGTPKTPGPLTVTDPDGNVVVVKDTVAYYTYLASCKTADSLFDAVLDRSEFDKYCKLLASQYDKDNRLKARTFATFIAKYPKAYPLMLSALTENVIDGYTTSEEIDMQMETLHNDSTVMAINSYISPNIAHYEKMQYEIISQTLGNTKTPMRKLAWSAFMRSNK